MQPRSSNTRAHPRAPFTEKVRYFEWDRARLAEATEISAGGLFLKTEAPLPEGKLLTLRLALPGSDEAFTVLARVVRTVRGGLFRIPGMGLQFIDIAARSRAAVDGYVRGRTLQPI